MPLRYSKMCFSRQYSKENYSIIGYCFYSLNVFFKLNFFAILRILREFECNYLYIILFDLQQGNIYTVCTVFTSLLWIAECSFLSFLSLILDRPATTPAAPCSRNKGICCFITLCLSVCYHILSCICAQVAVSLLMSVLAWGEGGLALKFLGLLMWAVLCFSSSIWPASPCLTTPSGPH